MIKMSTPYSTETLNTLDQTIEKLVLPGKGILAADESTGTMGKRLETIHVENTEENRNAYRGLLATTQSLGDHISGVILFEETLKQSANGQLIPELFAKQGIVPGIKVDKGLIPLANFENDKITQGLDGLQQRLASYKELGARFAKWRAVITISNTTPSYQAIMANAAVLARYASICQQTGIVPIVEPEVLMDGNHSLEHCATITEIVLTEVFQKLHVYQVSLEHMLLKPNMVIPGKDCHDQSNPENIAKATIRVLRRTVPAAVPSINFLSGGQSPEEATDNLQAINSIGQQPWQLSFSYGRALQEYCLKAWQGDANKVQAAQEALLTRARLNAEATQ